MGSTLNVKHFNWIHSRVWAEQIAAQTYTPFVDDCVLFLSLCLNFGVLVFVNEVIYSYCFPFLCKYIYFWCEVNIWIVNVCTECVVGMYSASDRNVSEGWIMGGSHFFIYIGSYIIFVYLFVCCYWFLWGGGHNFLHLLYYCYCHQFPVQGVQFMQQYSTTQHSDVKTPKPVIDASMPKVMYIVWTTFKLLRLFDQCLLPNLF